ncbi:MAG: 4Fe-4S dicluster domain-containing protein [Candidatus Marinimicrobia bacterium]|nr:4Fe-4S dicluster domain-containing protein [Candidatus Neomarinimicrobiota bacterium]
MINQSDTSQTAYDIRQPLYWDAGSLDAELNRVYDICTGCRLCFNLCPSFPVLFDALDAQGDALRQSAIDSGEFQAEEEKLDYLDLPEGEQQAVASAEATFIGSPEKLTHAEKWEVVDLCYMCKLCDPICPYTPDKEHEFQLDFPRLMLRSQAVRTKQRGVKMNDRFLANTDAAG